MNNERLCFREFSERDFDLLYSLFSNEDVMRHTIFETFTSPSAFKSFFVELINHNRTHKNRDVYEFAVFRCDDNSFVGMGVILVTCKNDFGGCGEIGYLLLPQHWGKGYATNIAQTLLKFGFSDLNLHRICARCNANNTASENVMKKTGMTKEGEIRKVRYKDGAWHNELVYGILVQEWDPGI